MIIKERKIGIRLLRGTQPLGGVFYFSTVTKAVILVAATLMILGITALIMTKPNDKDIQETTKEKTYDGN